MCHPRRSSALFWARSGNGGTQRAAWLCSSMLSWRPTSARCSIAVPCAPSAECFLHGPSPSHGWCGARLPFTVCQNGCHCGVVCVLCWAPPGGGASHLWRAGSHVLSPAPHAASVACRRASRRPSGRSHHSGRRGGRDKCARRLEQWGEGGSAAAAKHSVAGARASGAERAVAAPAADGARAVGERQGRAGALLWQDIDGAHARSGHHTRWSVRPRCVANACTSPCFQRNAYMYTERHEKKGERVRHHYATLLIVFLFCGCSRCSFLGCR